MVDVHGNDQADLLAGMSADDFKLANAVTKGHIHYVKLVSKIQRRLATILIHLPSRKHDRVVPSTVKRPEIRTLIESSSHTVIIDGSRIYCSSCCNNFWVHDAALRHWLSTQCPGSPAPPLSGPSSAITSGSASSLQGFPLPGTSSTSAASSGPGVSRPVPIRANTPRPSSVPIEHGSIHIGNRSIHASHHIMTHRGLMYCSRCGCVATNQARRLAFLCGPSDGKKRSRHGDNILKAIREDKLPKCLSLTRWPDGS
jgi:hypothetical protein